jgi:hypothetical protein
VCPVWGREHKPGSGRSTSSFVLPQPAKFILCVTTAPRLHDPSTTPWLGGELETRPETGLAPRGPSRPKTKRYYSATGIFAHLETTASLATDNSPITWEFHSDSPMTLDAALAWGSPQKPPRGACGSHHAAVARERRLSQNPLSNGPQEGWSTKLTNSHD